MPKMIIQPLVENAVFHGLEPKEESGMVGVFVGKEKERLAIRVWDSGCGMDEKELETLKISLRNLTGRVFFLCKSMELVWSIFIAD